MCVVSTSHLDDLPVPAHCGDLLLLRNARRDEADRPIEARDVRVGVVVEVAAELRVKVLDPIVSPSRRGDGKVGAILRPRRDARVVERAVLRLANEPAGVLVLNDLLRPFRRELSVAVVDALAVVVEERAEFVLLPLPAVVDRGETLEEKRRRSEGGVHEAERRM